MEETNVMDNKCKCKEGCNCEKGKCTCDNKAAFIMTGTISGVRWHKILVVVIGILILILLAGYLGYWYGNMTKVTVQNNLSSTANTTTSNTTPSVPAVATKINKMTFKREGNIYLSNEDGTNSINVSNLNSNENCQYYANYDSGFFQSGAFNNSLPWSTDYNKLAYFCENNTPTLYTYNLAAGTTASKDITKVYHGGGGGLNYDLTALDNDSNWTHDSNYFKDIKSSKNFNYDSNSGYNSGNTIWVMNFWESTNSSSNEEYILYDATNSKILYKWDRNLPTYSLGGINYHTWGVPQCIMNPVNTYEICSYDLVKGYDNTNINTTISILSLIDIKTGQITATKLGYINPMWSKDGKTLYATTYIDSSNDKDFNKLRIEDDTKKLEIVTLDMNLSNSKILLTDATNNITQLK